MTEESNNSDGTTVLVHLGGGKAEPEIVGGPRSLKRLSNFVKQAAIWPTGFYLNVWLLDKITLEGGWTS